MYLGQISNFHIFQVDLSNNVKNVFRLFISWISADLDIKNSKICLPIMQGANLFLLSKKSPKGNILFWKGNICHK